MTPKKMIFGHAESGLKIAVNRIDHHTTETNAAGESLEFLTEIELITEAGQSAIPTEFLDNGEPFKIRVAAGRETVELIRIL